MTNKEMEAMLRRAGEDLPGPAKAAPPMPPSPARRFRASRLVLVTAVVLMLTITVCAATLEVPIPDASEYGQWVWYFGNPEKYGLELERSYGAYALDWESEMWVVPKGATYVEAMFNATYRVLNFSYSNYPNGEIAEDRGDIDICAGKIDHPYWRAYFSMDTKDVPDNLHDMSVHTYAGYTLYFGEFRRDRSDDSMLCIKWVDYDEGFIYSLSFHGAMADRDAALEFTKQLIDANR